jgi:hypothetical protein
MLVWLSAKPRKWYKLKPLSTSSGRNGLLEFREGGLLAEKQAFENWFFSQLLPQFALSV